MNFDYYYKHFSQNSIGRYDISPLYSKPEVFKNLLHDLWLPFESCRIDKIICIEALGYVLGSAIATMANKGLVLVRKEGKIPLSKAEILSREICDYSGKRKVLELDRKLVSSNENFLLVDDWVETGTQARAVIAMVEELGGKIVGIACIGADRKERTEDLFEKYNLKAIGVNV